MARMEQPSKKFRAYRMVKTASNTYGRKTCSYPKGNQGRASWRRSKGGEEICS